MGVGAWPQSDKSAMSVKVKVDDGKHTSCLEKAGTGSQTCDDAFWEVEKGLTRGCL